MRLIDGRGSPRLHDLARALAMTVGRPGKARSRRVHAQAISAPGPGFARTPHFGFNNSTVFSTLSNCCCSCARRPRSTAFHSRPFARVLQLRRDQRVKLGGRPLAEATRLFGPLRKLHPGFREIYQPEPVAHRTCALGELEHIERIVAIVFVSRHGRPVPR